MIVIAKNAEKKLQQELALGLQTHRSCHCYYLPLSAVENQTKEEIFVPLLTLFHQVKNSYTAQIFICNDRDAFILIADLPSEDFAAFATAFSQEMHVPEFREHIQEYELNRDIAAVESLCRKKVVQAEAALAENQRREHMAQAGRLVRDMMEITPELLETLQTRRAERPQAHVLIVDDDQLCRSLAANILGKRYSCAVAKNSTEALKEYIGLAPDAMFLDIGLPDISGFDLLEHIFGLDPHAYIIMFSGRKDKENILKAVEMGAQGFVGKPFTGAQLLEYIQKSPFVRQKKERQTPLKHVTA